LLLIAVLLVGVSRNGGRRWINLGVGFNLQPSECAKIGTILMLANYLSRPMEELRQPKVFWKAIGLAAIPFGLIACEPDLGSALVIAPSCLAMMFVAGTPKMYLTRLVSAGAIFIAMVIAALLFAPPHYVPFIKSYQRDRVLTYFGKSPLPSNATPQERRDRAKQMKDKAYNVDQAMISVGSGGLTGKGWRQGTQYSLGFLPQAGAHNDFIFSVIAEEEGFVGSVVILTLYTVLLFCGIKIASQARDRLGKLMAIGVVALLFSHVFINIGMNIRLMPVTGIPLPLLSYGGSSVVCSLIAIGILHNIHIYRRSY
jgi:rod shape determining protein RodA